MTVGEPPTAFAATARVVTVALALGMAGSAPGAAETPGRITGEQGSYFILLDAEGPIAAWYWIGPETILLFTSAEGALLQPGPNQFRMVDRGLLPQRIVASYAQESRVLEYDGFPVFAGVGSDPIPIEVRTYGLALTPEAILDPQRRDEQAYTLHFRWLAEDVRNLPSGAVVAQRYEAGASGGDRIASTPRQRVYLPAYDVDLDARVWDQATDVRSGAGLVASTDLIFVTWPATDLDPAVAGCLTALHESPEYVAYAGEFAGLEWRSTILLPQGYSDMAALGRADYRELDRRTGIPERFQDCFRRDR